MAILLLAPLLAIAGCRRSPTAETTASNAAKQPAAAGVAAAPSTTAPSAAAPSTTAPSAAALSAVAPSTTAAAAAPSTTAAAAAPSTTAAAAATASSAAAPAAGRDEPGAIAPGARVDTGIFGLLCQGAQDGNLPEDFEIGPLGAARLLAEDERAAYAAISSLLGAYVQGRVDRAGLAADSRDALAGMIAFALEQGDTPAFFRLGPPRSSGSELVANLRLLGTDGSAEGEVYVKREGGHLLVSDLQIDPARMRVRREKAGRTFFPSPYRWLLGG
jgi:hypothetical protein